ncbi:hypothetical protein [Streptomyces sp. NPDC051993]|uniref:hypothetical protein n=1 Tax=Streptomyces sp. NPDC051993 TaxID=3155286 RepID=UPI00343000BA
MSGRHAAEAVPSRPGLAVGILAALGLAPPVLIVGPQLVGAHAAVGVSRPDVEHDVAGASVRPETHTTRWGVRSTS